MDKLSYKTLFLIVIFLLIPIVFLLRLQQHPPHKVFAEWWNDAWTYRQAITITVSSSATDILDLDTNISIGTSALVAAGKLQSNCADLRFTDVSGNILPYFIDSGCNTATTKIWIRANLVPKNTTTYTVYVYYGNPSASGASDSTTFNLYNGLVGYWNFNENTGTSAANLSFNANSFTMTSGTTPSWLTNGKYGVGVSFNGSGQSTTTTLSGINSSAGAYNALSFWMYWNGVTGKIPISFQGPYDLYLNTSTCIGFNTGYSDNYGFNPTPLALSGRWAHFVMNFYNGDYTGHNEIYVDGVKQTLSQCLGSTQSRTLNPSPNLVIGNFANGGNYFFGGALDDVRVYNRYLNAADVAKLYNNPGSIVNISSVIAKPSVSFAAEELGGGPVAWWKFDEGVGTSIIDSSSLKNHGYFVSSPQWKPESECIAGKCLYFNGSSRIDLTDSGRLDFTNQSFTTSVWVRIPSYYSAATTCKSYPVIANDDWGWKLSIGNSGNPYFGYYYNASNSIGVSSPTPISLNQWHHLASVLSVGTSQVFLYVDGKLQNTNSIPNSNIYYSPADSPHIGSITGCGSQDIYFTGFIDDIKLYPYARSAKQIQQDYATGISGQSTSHGQSVAIGSQSVKSLSDGLVGYWKFDEGTGTTSADSSGNNNLATFGSGTSAPSWSPGKYGVGLSFDGTNDYATITTGSTTPSSGSLSLWINPSSLPATNAPFFYAGDIYFWVQTYANPAQNFFRLRLNTTSGMEYIDTPGNIFPALNTWSNLVATWQNTGSNIKVNLYLNSQLVKSGQTIGTPNFSNNVYSLSRYSGQYYNGLMDELRLYNRALSPSEVKALYNYAPGPVGYWKFDEGVGTTAYDSSGNGKNGSFWNPISWTTGKIGKAISIGSTQAYVDTNLYLNYNLNSYTLNAWIYPTTNGSAFITNTSDSNYFNGNALSVSNNTTLSWALRYNSGVGTTIITATIPSGLLNKWSYITAIANKIDATNTLYTLYVNGIAVTSATYAFTYPSPATRPYRFGVVYTDFSQYGPYSGKIDEVKIYNYARTQSQILEDMGTGPGSKDPVLWYKFDEGQGSVTYNWGIGGTLTGNFGGTIPTWSSDSKSGKSLFFTASTSSTGSRVTTSPRNIGTTTGDTLTISTWLKPNSSQTNSVALFVRNGIGADLNYGSFISNLSGGYYKFNFHYYDGTGFRTITSTTAFIPANQWSHLTIVITQGTNVQVFLNGVLKETLAWVNGNSVSATSSLNIGGHAGTTAQSYDGYIDDFKIYNYALSSDEIKEEYNRGATLVVGASTQTIGATTTSLDYCIPGDTSPCSPPIAEWKFDEGVGTTAFDTSGNNLNAGWTGTLGSQWTTGKIGTAGLFNGTNNYLTCSATSQITSLTTYTVESWVKTTDTSTLRPLIGFGSNAYPGFYPNYSSGRALIYLDANNYRYFNNSPTNIFDNNWHHIAFLVTGNGQNDIDNSKMYVDGKEQTVWTTYKTGSPSSITACYIGRANVYRYNGLADNIRIYNYARTPAQISYDYNRGGPVGWWKMDECQGTTIADWSGNANHGTLNIGASGTQTSAGTCTTSGTAWGIGATGKINSSLNFDGSDDYLNVTNSSSLNLTGNFSISAWVKPIDFSNGEMIIINKSSNDCGNYQFAIYGGKLAMPTNGGCNWSSAGNNSSLVAGVWQHVLVSWNGSLLKYYINGVNTDTINGWAAGGTNALDVQIGGRGSPISDSFKGQIDDVRIYNYALTSAQVKTLYNGGAVNFK